MIASQNKGFTLIEVLVALAILSIALTAILYASSQHIRNTIYLQDKTSAFLVGNEIINEARAGLIKEKSGEQNYFNVEWHWEVATENTPNPNIKKIICTVSKNRNKLIELTSFVHAEK